MLWVPSPAFRSFQTALPATPITTNTGFIITGSATTHTKGAWSTLIASANFDTSWVSINILNTRVSVTRTDQLLDIGVGAAASEQVILPNLLSGWISELGGGHQVNLPLRIPKGTRIAARLQGLIASDTASVGITLYGGDSNPSWHTFTRADDYGTATASSTGTYLDPPTTAGTESAWTSIGGTTTRPYDGLLLRTGGTGADTTTTGIAYHIEVGYSSTTLAEFWIRGDTGEFFHPLVPSLPIFAPIPTGTQLQARIEQSGTDTQDLDVALYGLY